MKRDFILTTSGKAASALSCAALSLLACAQAGAQVAPPQAQGPSGVRVEGAGGGVQGVRSGAPTDWVLQLKSGQISPEEAWNRGLLTASNAGRVIWSAEITGEKHRDLRLRMAGLLAERAPEVLGPKVGHPELQNLAGFYYRTQKDARAVGFLEAVLEKLLQERQAQQKNKTVGNLAGTRNIHVPGVAPLSALAFFYEETNQYLKAAQTWDRAKNYFADPHWLADLTFLAARAYMKVGDEAKAKERYDQVLQYGDGFYTGLTLLDQADVLIKQGKHQEARKMLNTPLADGKDADIARITQQCRLAYSYYQAGEFEKVPEVVQRAEKQYKGFQTANPNLERDYGLKGEVLQAKLYLRYIEQWKKGPLVVEPQSLKIVLNTPSELNQPLKRRISLRTFRPSAFTLHTNSPHVKAALTQGKGSWTGQRRHYAEQEVTVEIEPQSLLGGEKEVTTEIVVSVPQAKPLEFRIPITLVRGPAP